MDLALEFGMPAEQLARQMTERELGKWALRAREQWLPGKRIEWYLAQIAWLISVTMGGAKDVSIDDYKLKLEPADAEPEEASAEDARLAFGFNPIKKVAA